MGPVVSKGQYDKVWTYIDNAKSQGVELAYGGDRALVAHCPAGGMYIPPTLFVNVSTSNTIWREEIFGPVLCLNTFETEAEAMALAHDTEFGLAAAVLSADPARCARVGRAFRCGVVWANCSQPTFMQAPWGGMKATGFGKSLGRWGFDEFVSIKQITTCKNDFNWGLWDASGADA